MIIIHFDTDISVAGLLLGIYLKCVKSRLTLVFSLFFTWQVDKLYQKYNSSFNQSIIAKTKQNKNKGFELSQQTEVCGSWVEGISFYSVSRVLPHCSINYSRRVYLSVPQDSNHWYFLNNSYLLLSFHLHVFI